jgi:hypothetical protein
MVRLDQVPATERHAHKSLDFSYGILDGSERRNGNGRGLGSRGSLRCRVAVADHRRLVDRGLEREPATHAVR